MMLPICVLLILQIAYTTGSKCSDAAESNNIPYIRMCEDNSVTSDKVILDTHSAGATGETTCSCTVNATLIFSVYVQHYGNGLNPSSSGCGSEVVIRDATGNRDRSYTCNTFPGPSLVFSQPMTITWSGLSCGDSKYCLSITGIVLLPNTTFTLTCSNPETPTTLQTPPTTTITTTTTTQGDVTTTNVDMNTPTVSQTTSTTGTSFTSTKASAIRCNLDEEGTICLSVPAFATIVVFTCLIMVYATVVTILYDTCRRCLSSLRRHQNENTNGPASNTQSEESYVNMPVQPSSDRTYEGLELSHVDLSTNTYEVLGNSGT